MRENISKMLVIINAAVIFFSTIFIICPSEQVNAGSYDGEDLALAILGDPSTLIDSQYADTDQSGHRQAGVFSSLGTMQPTNGSTFAVFSTGIAGYVPVTTDEEDPGDERGSWFQGGQKGYPRDEATLTMTLQVPSLMTYLTYDAQFLSAEYPEYIGTQYNDQLTVTVNSPSQGISTYTENVNSGIFRLEASEITGTGFNIFATSGNPEQLDIVTTTVGPGGDAGATLRFPAEHPVLGPEEVTVTINIKDSGDNMVDSAAFIDNISFSEEAQVSITARKTVHDIEGNLIEYAECGDTIEYRVDIVNGGEIQQNGNEFEDILSENITYVNDSLTAEYGVANYVPGEHKITWAGDIPENDYVRITFQATVNNDLVNGTIVANEGIVQWDSDNNGINDANASTGYVNVTIIVFEPPSSVTEDFSDDAAGGAATESYQNRQWFETTNGRDGSTFEVVQSYYYSTSNAFKTKIRSSGSPQYWNYSLLQLESDIKSWEAWFACGNASEASDLYLDFKNGNGNDITRLKFEYVNEGSEPPLDWVLTLSYWSPGIGWVRLNTDFSGGYLYNSWYRLKIEKNGASYINYSLYRNDHGLVDFKTGQQLGSSFSNLSSIEWSNTQNPIVCPMFFWDEHILELT